MKFTINFIFAIYFFSIAANAIAQTGKIEYILITSTLTPGPTNKSYFLLSGFNNTSGNVCATLASPVTGVKRVALFMNNDIQGRAQLAMVIAAKLNNSDVTVNLRPSPLGNSGTECVIFTVGIP